MSSPNYHLGLSDTFAGYLPSMPILTLAEIREIMPIPEHDAVSVSTALNVTLPTATSQETVVSAIPQDETTPYDEHSPFLKLQRRLESLSQLKDNWNTYGAAAPNKTALFWSYRVLHELYRLNFAPITVSASSDEGVAIFFNSEDRRASIECLNNGEILGVVSLDSGALEIWNISQSHIGHSVNTIKTILNK